MPATDLRITFTSVFFFRLMFSRAGSMQLAQHHVWDMEWDLYKDDGSMLVAWSNALYTTDGIQGTNVAGDIDSAGYVEGKGERYCK